MDNESLALTAVVLAVAAWFITRPKEPIGPAGEEAGYGSGAPLLSDRMQAYLNQLAQNNQECNNMIIIIEILI